jgi:MFS family permease
MAASAVSAVDSRYAAFRLAVALLVMTVGAAGMYVIPVVLPSIQADFGLARADASLAYAFVMVGFGAGSLPAGRLVDRFGLALPLAGAGLCLGLGFVIAGRATSFTTFCAAHGLLIGLLGSSATFGPMMADTAQWWNRRRGIAVAICASGNFLGGAIWPPLIQWGVESWGWRTTYVGVGLASAIGIVALAALLRPRPPAAAPALSRPGFGTPSETPFGLPSRRALLLLCVASVSCCIAMAMPQVHIVALCVDLGFGPARGAEMLALMLACGIVSRLAGGMLADRIGALRVLLLGSAMQATALALFLPVRGLVPLYVISALFGLFQGAIVPSYAVVIREYFPARKTGGQVGAVIMCAMLGMALGGWMSGRLFDLTGSYRVAIFNGIAWNLLNLAIVATLLLRTRKAVAAGRSISAIASQQA